MERIVVAFIMAAILLGKAVAEDDILARSDAAYIPRNFRYELSIDTVNARGQTETTTMRGYKKGNELNLLVVLQPAALSGIAHLRKGPVIWTYYPTLKKNIKSSFQSLVLGSILSYGDLVAFSLSEDYRVDSEATEGDSLRLTLVPKPRREGYAKVLLWLDKKTLIPKNREYYSLSGMIMKTCEVKKLTLSPSGLLTELIEEYYEPARKTRATIRISGVNADASIPDRYFNPDQLRYMSGE